MNRFRLDKKYTPFLFKAIEAVRASDLVSSGRYDVENFNIAFEDVLHERDGVHYYTVSFYAEEVTAQNWMTATAAEVGGVHVDIDAGTRQVIRVYGDR